MSLRSPYKIDMLKNMKVMKKKLQAMKNYIKNEQSSKKDTSERRSKAYIKQKASLRSEKLRSELFLGQEVKSSIEHLQKVFRVDMKVLKDDEIAIRKVDLPKELQQMDKISNMLHSLLQSSNSVVENQIDNIWKGTMRSIK